MTAAEHYQEAGRLLGEAADAHAITPLGPTPMFLVAAAQAHATLATASVAAAGRMPAAH
jgi:hypothetical protein